MSSPLNPINVRIPQFDLETVEGRQAAHRYLASGIVDLNQAIAYLKANPQSTTTTNTIIQTGGSGGGGGGSSVVGGVNNQIGVTAYTTQQSDYGVKLLMGDSSPVTVTLNPGVTTPWFTFIGNDSSAMVSLTAGSPATLQGQNYIEPGLFGIVFYDGANFWSEGVPMATASSLGIVRPDNVTIHIDSSGIISAGASSLVGVLGATIGASDVGNPQFVTVPYNATIVDWTIMADVSGSASVDAWFLAGSAPPSTPSIPTSANKISASAPIALSSAQSSAGGSVAISTWTKTLTQWGTLAFNLTSATTLNKVFIQIQVTRS